MQKAVEWEREWERVVAWPQGWGKGPKNGPRRERKWAVRTLEKGWGGECRPRLAGLGEEWVPGWKFGSKRSRKKECRRVEWHEGLEMWISRWGKTRGLSLALAIGVNFFFFLQPHLLLFRSEQSHDLRKVLKNIFAKMLHESFTSGIQRNKDFAAVLVRSFPPQVTQVFQTVHQSRCGSGRVAQIFCDFTHGKGTSTIEKAEQEVLRQRYLTLG